MRTLRQPQHSHGQSSRIRWSKAVRALPNHATSGHGNVWRAISHNKLSWIGILIYLLCIMVALFAPLIAPFGPDQAVTVAGQWAANAPPGLVSRFGTTSLARDIFSQLVFGTRAALLVGLSTAFLVVVTGTIIGLISGYYGGWVDSLLMRLADLVLAIPFLPLVIVLVAFWGPSLSHVVLAMGLLWWSDIARVVRSQVLTLRERGYVKAARVSGASDLRIMFVHIAPSVLPTSLLYGALAIGWGILTEASVAFLGFGDPKIISWGYMLQDAYISQALSRGAYYWFVPPGICIMLMVIAGFFVGRGAEESLRPARRGD